MKRPLLLLALGLGTATAAGSGTINTTVTANVVNVCRIINTFTYPVNLGNYSALDGANPSGTPLNVQCTKGTQINITPDSGTAQLQKQGSTSADALGVRYQVIDPNLGGGSPYFRYSNDSGDYFFGFLKVSAPKDQWTTSAGNYSGTIALTVTWN